jgi:hypothetical protein
MEFPTFETNYFSNGSGFLSSDPTGQPTKCDIFTTRTSSATLNNALKRIYSNKSEMLLVLRHPEIPLHNNLSENGIRDYVKKRKISGST